MRLLNYLTAFFLLLILNNCSPTTNEFDQPWERYNDPQTAGFSTAKLDSITGFIRDSVNTTGLVAIYNGKLLYEYGNIEELSYLASCRKSILSILYGKYVENGTINLEQSIGELGLDEDDGLLDSEKAATVDHIITSRSGVFHVPSNGGYDEKNILERGAVAAGKYFVYNNWDFNAAGYIFEQAAGNSIYEELETQLAIPLGFEDWDQSAQRKYFNNEKSRYPAYHIYLSTRDMAKIGQLMLNKGEWHDQKIVSADWTRKIITPVTPRDTVVKRTGIHEGIPEFSYAYMWWCFEELNNNPVYKGSYTASGYGGQWITVIPEINLVVAHKTNFSGDNPRFTRTQHYWKIVDMLVNARN